MEGEKEPRSCWYTRLQGALYLLAFLTFGIGDTITSVWMIGQRGIMGEANPLLRYIIIHSGISGYVGLKIVVTIVILSVPFVIQTRSHQAFYWMINGYLVSFAVAGTLASILNIKAARNEVIFLSPGYVVFLFLSSVLVLTYIGEEIDRRTNPKIRGYIDCAVYDIMSFIALLIRFRRKIKH